MAITALIGWDCTAEIQGIVRRVSYDGNEKTLTMHGVLMPDAYSILNALGTGKMVAVNPSEAVLGTSLPMKKETEGSAPLPVSEKKDVAPQKASEAPKKEEKPEALAQVHNIGDVPEKIAKTKRFIEFLDWLMKAKNLKVSQVDEIVAEVTKFKESIPVVSRIGDIRERVLSNLVAYEEAGDAAS